MGTQAFYAGDFRPGDIAQVTFNVVDVVDPQTSQPVGENEPGEVVAIISNAFLRLRP